MNRTKNRRKAARLRYQVAVRFGHNARNLASEGQMLDVSSGGLAFRCKADPSCPRAGQRLATHFSIPGSGVQEGSSMMEFNRTGRVLRVQEVNPLSRNVAVQFDEPLPVGKVFFDTIGLYLSSPAGRPASTDDHAGEDLDPSLEGLIEQRIEQMEQELAQLKQFRDTHYGTAE